MERHIDKETLRVKAGSWLASGSLLVTGLVLLGVDWIAWLLVCKLLGAGCFVWRASRGLRVWEFGQHLSALTFPFRLFWVDLSPSAIMVCLLYYLAVDCWVLFGLFLPPLVSLAVCPSGWAALPLVRWASTGFCWLAYWSARLGLVWALSQNMGLQFFRLPSSTLSSKLFFGLSFLWAGPRVPSAFPWASLRGRGNRGGLYLKDAKN
ncbi:hypothetical protein SADUNF_Sadunf15G0044300 [Salix dunnii]|uniref:Uncharacterized protein n=1 Tax=Salix dunnii TaxID=1413687 RepID=A0A835JC08_9ROSI|nr:hypothetical protein SADUNF_Sadunf15G0044300 [Salix dunnii]